MKNTRLPGLKASRVFPEKPSSASPASLPPPGSTPWRTRPGATSNFINSFQTERRHCHIDAVTGAVLRSGGCLAAESPESQRRSRWGNPPPPYLRRNLRHAPGGRALEIPARAAQSWACSRSCATQSLTGQPYQAHGWFISRQNPVALFARPPAHPGSLRENGLHRHGGCHTSNDTAWFSDVILPESTYLERFDPLSVVDGTIFIRQPVHEPLGESRSGLMIYKEPGERLDWALLPV